MDAITALCEHLEACLKNDADPNPPQSLLEAVSMQFALAQHGIDQLETIGPPITCYSIERSPDVFNPLVYIADDDSIAFGYDSMIATLGLSDGRIREMPERDFPYKYYQDRSRSPDGRYYVDMRDYVGVFDAKTDRELTRLRWERGSSEASTSFVVFSQDSRFIAVSYGDDTAIRVWRAESWQLLGEFAAKGHEAVLEFSPDGRFLLVGARFGIDLLHLETWCTVYSYRTEGPNSIGYHPSGEAIFGATVDPSIYAVDLSPLSDRQTLAIEQILSKQDLLRTLQQNARSISSSWRTLLLLTYEFED